MNNYRHVLVAVDFSATADEVLNKAMDIASRNKSKLSMLHVVEYLPPIDSAYEPILASNWNIDEKLLLEQAEKSLQKFADKHQLSDAAQHVVLGTPKYEISQFVKDQHCDLVVLGSHGQHGIGLLLGSTANAVLHDMPCDVLAVKVSK